MHQKKADCGSRPELDVNIGEKAMRSRREFRNRERELVPDMRKMREEDCYCEDHATEVFIENIS
jgi:hypothetical protein